MTPIEQLKDWWKREPRPEYAYQVVGDTIDARAILELADALRLLEADVRELARRMDKVEAALSHVPQARFEPDATESPPEPFRICGPGRYRMRNGEEARITQTSSLYGGWRGDALALGQTVWMGDGHKFTSGGPDPWDIVARVDEPEQPEMAGLTGYAVISGNAEIVGQARAVAYKHFRAATLMGDEDEVVIDLAKVPASAIVRPEQKTEPKRITGWMNFYDRPVYGQMPDGECIADAGSAVWSSRKAADNAAEDAMNDHEAARTACIYIDVLEGEGLGDTP